MVNSRTGHDAVPSLPSASQPTQTGASRPIKWSILWPFVLVLLFVIGAFLSAVYLEQRRVWGHELNEWSTLVDRLVATRLRRDTDSLRGTLFSLLDNQAVATAFAHRDRDQLLQLIQALFAQLRTLGISHLYFILPDRSVLLRVHAPDHSGDRIDRPSLLQAQRSDKGSSGLELGPLGTLTLRVVEPWSLQGKPIGYIEIGEPIDQVLYEVHDVLGYDLLVLGRKQFLDRDGWGAGRQVSGNSWPWERLPDSVALGSTLSLLPPELLHFLGGARDHDAVLLPVADPAATLSVSVHTLRDSEARAIAELVMVRDMSSRQAAMRKVLAITAMLSLLVGAVVFIMLLFILNRVERDRRRQQTLVSEFSRLNRDHRRIVQVEKLSAMGMMVGEIAHQINNPLVGVINMAQLAQREADDPQRVRDLLGDIQHAGSDCHTLVQRMLDFARIARFEHEAAELGPILAGTVQLARQSLSPRPRIELDLPTEPVCLQVDPVLVRHALFNLITNAVQASPPQATIKVRLEATADPDSGRPGWCLRVLDHGPGFSDEARKRAFEPFFSTRAEGTGLGLLVVQQVALLHHGWVELCDRTEAGAEVALWLPDPKGGDHGQNHYPVGR